MRDARALPHDPTPSSPTQLDAPAPVADRSIGECCPATRWSARCPSPSAALADPFGLDLGLGEVRDHFWKRALEVLDEAVEPEETEDRLIRRCASFAVAPHDAGHGLR